MKKQREQTLRAALRWLPSGRLATLLPLCHDSSSSLSLFPPINTNIKRGEGGGNREKDLKTEGDVCSRTKGRRTKKQKGRKTVTNRGGEKKK
jgi:hypothetical protein